eukprot:393506-Pleurochrysis_carterae.AAC.1
MYFPQSRPVLSICANGVRVTGSEGVVPTCLKRSLEAMYTTYSPGKCLSTNATKYLHISHHTSADLDSFRRIHRHPVLSSARYAYGGGDMQTVHFIIFLPAY